MTRAAHHKAATVLRVATTNNSAASLLRQRLALSSKHHHRNSLRVQSRAQEVGVQAPAQVRAVQGLRKQQARGPRAIPQHHKRRPLSGLPQIAQLAARRAPRKQPPPSKAQMHRTQHPRSKAQHLPRRALSKQKPLLRARKQLPAQSRALKVPSLHRVTQPLTPLNRRRVTLSTGLRRTPLRLNNPRLNDLRGRQASSARAVQQSKVARRLRESLRRPLSGAAPTKVQPSGPRAPAARNRRVAAQRRAERRQAVQKSSPHWMMDSRRSGPAASEAGASTAPQRNGKQTAKQSKLVKLASRAGRALLDRQAKAKEPGVTRGASAAPTPAAPATQPRKQRSCSARSRAPRRTAPRHAPAPR